MKNIKSWRLADGFCWGLVDSWLGDGAYFRCSCQTMLGLGIYNAVPASSLGSLELPKLLSLRPESPSCPNPKQPRPKQPKLNQAAHRHRIIESPKPCTSAVHQYFVTKT